VYSFKTDAFSDAVVGLPVARDLDAPNDNIVNGGVNCIEIPYRLHIRHFRSTDPVLIHAVERFKRAIQEICERGLSSSPCCDLRLTHDWRGEEFAILREIVAAASALPEWLDYAGFCSDQERDIRQQAFRSLVPHPLQIRIIEPTLLEWVKVEPSCSEAHCWTTNFLPLTI